MIKREVETLKKNVGPTTKDSLKETRDEEKLMAEMLQYYNVVYNGIPVKIKGVEPWKILGANFHPWEKLRGFKF